MTAPTVLSVGQCGFDSAQIQRVFSEEFAVEVREAHSASEASRQLRDGYSLVLVNRILDSTGEQGMDVIRAVRQAAPDTPVMLVSNYEEAQDAAVAAGAERGFGKRELGDPGLADKLRPYFT